VYARCSLLASNLLSSVPVAFPWFFLLVLEWNGLLMGKLLAS
jgi:hypothetical protein